MKKTARYIQPRGTVTHFEPQTCKSSMVITTQTETQERVRFLCGCLEEAEVQRTAELI